MTALVLEKNEIASSSQQTDITNNNIDTNTQTTNYIDDNYLSNNKIATVTVNPTPSLNEKYLWIPETSDNVVPGLYSMITYISSLWKWFIPGPRSSDTGINHFQIVFLATTCE